MNKYIKQLENVYGNQEGKYCGFRKYIKDLIDEGKSYVCIDNDKIVAVFYYDYGYKIEPTYNIIDDGAWIEDDNYGVVHRAELYM